MAHKLQTGQTVYRIEWEKYRPILVSVIPDKVNSQSVYVNGKRHPARMFSSSPEEAFDTAYGQLFFDWDMLWGEKRREKGVTREDTARWVSRLHRLHMATRARMACEAYLASGGAPEQTAVQ